LWVLAPFLEETRSLLGVVHFLTDDGRLVTTCLDRGLRRLLLVGLNSVLLSIVVIFYLDFVIVVDGGLN